MTDSSPNCRQNVKASREGGGGEERRAFRARSKTSSPCFLADHARDHIDLVSVDWLLLRMVTLFLPTRLLVRDGEWIDDGHGVGARAHFAGADVAEARGHSRATRENQEAPARP